MFGSHAQEILVSCSGCRVWVSVDFKNFPVDSSEQSGLRTTGLVVKSLDFEIKQILVHILALLFSYCATWISYLFSVSFSFFIGIMQIIIDALSDICES